MRIVPRCTSDTRKLCGQSRPDWPSTPLRAFDRIFMRRGYTGGRAALAASEEIRRLP
jgi:hypothetical protein